MKTSLYTRVVVDNFFKKIQAKDNILFIGSCFSQNIGEQFCKAFQNCVSNPCGIVYNPLSLLHTLELLGNDHTIHADELFYHDELYAHFDFSTKFSHPDCHSAMSLMNKSLNRARDLFQKPDHLFLTFGSAFYYEHLESQAVVSNCHKLPAAHFQRQLLDVADIVKKYKEFLHDLIATHPNISIIFTVSPVRHWKDGARQNNISKSTLHLAIYELQKIFPKNTSYFPAYEIQMDELRDYRFYAKDLLHPSESAIEMIQNTLIQKALADDAKKQFIEMDNLYKMLEHRILFPDTNKSRDFQKQIGHRIQELQDRYGLDLSGINTP